MLKGWLFYRQTAGTQPLVYGLAQEHCRGFWWTLAEVAQLSIPYALILGRMEWLAPAQTRPDLVMERDMLQEAISRHFQQDQSPVMIAIMRKNGNLMQEFCRGMVVPDDWLERANVVRQQRLVSKRKS